MIIYTNNKHPISNSFCCRCLTFCQLCEYNINNCKVFLQIDKTNHNDYSAHLQTQTFDPNNKINKKYKKCHEHMVYFLHYPSEEEIKKYSLKIEKKILK